MATGMGVDLCLPVMRNAMEKKGGLLSYAEAKATLLQCVRLAYLRDCRSWPKYHLASIDGELVKTVKLLNQFQNENFDYFRITSINCQDGSQIRHQDYDLLS